MSSAPTTDLSDVLKLLYSSVVENEGSVDMVHVQDEGSCPKCARVDVNGVPMYGVIDSG